jgi:serpin B
MGLAKLSAWTVSCFCLLVAVAQATDLNRSPSIVLNPYGKFTFNTGFEEIPILVVTESPEEVPSSGNQIPPHERAPLSIDVGELVAGNNQFALDIYRRLSSKQQTGDNVLISPLSISTAMGMAFAGACGRTAEQMAAVLGFNLPSDRLHPAFGELIDDLDATREGYQLSIANRLFAQEGFEFNPQFLNVASQHYQAPVEMLDYVNKTEESRQRINAWVEEKTNDRIHDLLSEGSVSSDTRLVLTNAIYFNGQWKSKFKEENTHTAQFHAADGTVLTTSMMQQTHSFLYGEFDGYKALEMPYAGDDLSLVVFLPDSADGIEAFEASLTSELIDSTLAGMDQQKVSVFLPKFKFEASFSLGLTLQDMGMTDAFLDPDFSGMSDANLAVSDVLHKAFIEVNEAGTEAAAATAVIFEPTSIGIYNPPATFRADHPFLFALRDTYSGSLMFMGRVSNPGESILTLTGNPAVPEPSTAALLAGGLLAFFGRRVSRKPWASKPCFC